MNMMPPVTKNLLIINVLCFLGMYVAELHGVDLNGMLGLHFFLADNFMPYQLLTYMFMHGNLEHIFFNMFAVWMFGRIIADRQTSAGDPRAASRPFSITATRSAWLRAKPRSWRLFGMSVKLSLVKVVFLHINHFETI